MKMLIRLFLFITLLFLPVAAGAQDYVRDADFAPVFDNRVTDVVVLSDRKILVAGTFETVNGVPRKNLVRLNPDGSIDTSFNAGAVMTSTFSITGIQLLSDGKILLSGAFGSDGAGGVRNVLRLNPDGSADSAFTSFPSSSGASSSLFVPERAEQLANGKIILCGDFTGASGNTRANVARFNNDGSYDPTFTTTLDVWCNDVKALADGKYFLGGFFSTVDGGAKQGMARFNGDGTLDNSFDLIPPPGGRVNPWKIVLKPDGKIALYSRVFSQSSPAGDLLTTINAGGGGWTGFPNGIFGGQNVDFAFLSGQRTLVTHEFSEAEFYRINADGSQDISMNTVTFSSQSHIYAIAAQADGKILVGGLPLFINGVTVGSLIRLKPDSVPAPAPFDFDGDGKTDISVFRPGDRYWYTHLSGGSYVFTNWGLSADKPVAADYDNDGRADIAVFRGGIWYIIKSSNSAVDIRSFGAANDHPFTADYNGDHRVDMVVRQAQGGSVLWRFQDFEIAGLQTNLQVDNEQPLDIPVTGDFNGDGEAEVGFFRNGDWYSKNAGASSLTAHFLWGMNGDIPVPGDYDGDGRTDYAVFRPSSGVWYILGSATGYTAAQWGIAGDIPIPGDYDGDGKMDIAVYRGGSWYLLQSTAGFNGESWGLAGDIPIPAQSGF
jgi:uncharacterized delta-60 repeat protein